jgi:hypothetical protein
MCSPRLLKVIVLGNLVAFSLLPHTRFTYHKTWETGLEVAAKPLLLTPHFFVYNQSFRQGPLARRPEPSLTPNAGFP